MTRRHGADRPMTVVSIVLSRTHDQGGGVPPISARQPAESAPPVARGTGGRSRRRFALLLSMMAATAGGPACTRAPDPAAGAAPEPVVVTLVPVESRELPDRVRITGTLFPEIETTISAEVAGQVVAVHHDLGDLVSPGAPLAEIDPESYRLVRDERERAFQQALARLGLSAMPSPDFDLDALPGIERARLEAANARARYERGRALAERTPPMISEQEFFDLRTAWEVAESEVRVQRLASTALLAEAATLEAQIRIAARQLRETRHTAPPREGVAGGAAAFAVAARFVTEGDFVTVGTPLFRLIVSDPLRLRARLPEHLAGRVLTGSAVALRVEAGRELHAGVVARISPSVDEATRTFLVEVRVENPDRVLKPGSFATADIDIGTRHAVVVPDRAVRTFAGIHKILVVRDGAAAERRVQIGERGPDWIEIRDGAAPGEAIMLAAPASVVTGTPVRVADTEAGDGR